MYKLIRSMDDFDRSIIDPDHVVFGDTETMGETGKTEVKLKKDGSEEKGGLYGKVRLIQLYQKGWREAVLFDCHFIDLFSVLPIIQDLHMVFHNGSYDLHTINCHTSTLWHPRKADDTFYLSKLEYPEQTSFDFYSCLEHSGHADQHIRAIDKKEQQKTDWSKNLTEDHLRYAAFDVLYLSLLWDSVESQRDTESYQLDIKNQRHAIDYDRRGMPIDQKELKRLKCKSIVKLEKAMTDIPVNINSSKQCCEWLDAKSSAKEVLGHMAIQGNKKADDLLKARKHSKLLTFIKNYDAETVYGFHNACGARTGRMSCSGGNRYFCNNTQQPPRDILSCICAPKGKKLVYKDYAGLELRMACTWVGEPRMAELMFNEVDQHTYTGSKIFNVPFDDVTDFQRMIGKILNFLMIYGGSVKAAQATFTAWGGIIVPYKETKELIAKWFDEYPYFTEWHEMNKKHLGIYGFMDIFTALGRPIRTYSLNDSLNFPIQGSSVEVTKTAVDYLETRYGADPEIINVVHDSITLLKDDDQAELWKDRLNECMIDAWYYVIKDLAIPDLPMPAEAEIKQRWSKIKE